MNVSLNPIILGSSLLYSSAISPPPPPPPPSIRPLWPTHFSLSLCVCHIIYLLWVFFRFIHWRGARLRTNFASQHKGQTVVVHLPHRWFAVVSVRTSPRGLRTRWRPAAPACCTWPVDCSVIAFRGAPASCLQWGRNELRCVDINVTQANIVCGWTEWVQLKV